MKALLVMMILVVSSSCVTSPAPSRRQTNPAVQPTRGIGAGGGSGAGCDSDECGLNGTHMTGLTRGDDHGAITAIILPSGEVIALP
jgi:hypothetical protein